MGISFAGFKCQQVITATAYTIVGVMNKMLTVLINVLIWDKHASATGIASLAGAPYPPRRARCAIAQVDAAAPRRPRA